MTGEELIRDDFAQSTLCKDGRHRDLRAWNRKKVECCLNCGSFYTISSKLHSFLKFNDEIRILKLLPGTEISDLSGELIHARLRDQPIYDAVSYTWADESGDATCSSNLFIESKNGILKITRNCAAALRKFRDKRRPKFLWVDAVCIDQCNLLERSEQVQLMTSIYRQAKTVKVFVGNPHKKYLLDYHKLFEYIKAKRCGKKNRSGPYSQSKSPLLQILSVGSMDDTSTRLRSTLIQFLGYSWFHRIWIIQEVAMAQAVTLYFGDFIIDWGDISMENATWGSSTELNSGEEAFVDVGSLFERNIPPVLCVRNNIKLKKAAFHELLAKTRRCAATDPRDKIFALLGIARATAGLPLPYADYTKSVNQVFTEAAIYHIRSTQSLSILTEFLSLGEFATSWVPDFSDTRFVSLPSSSWPGCIDSRNETAKSHFLNDNIAMRTHQTWNLTFIYARGTFLDSIAYVQHTKYRSMQLTESIKPLVDQAVDEEIGEEDEDKIDDKIHKEDDEEMYEEEDAEIDEKVEEVFDKEKDEEKFLARFRELFQEQSTFQVPHSLLHRSVDTMDSLPFIEPSPGADGFNMESVDLLAPFFEYKEFSKQGSHSRYCSAALDALLQLHSKHSHARAIFYGGYFVGILPGCAKTGDQIWLLGTTAHPLVLRQQGENYKVIGPCMLVSPCDCKKWCRLQKYNLKIHCQCKFCTHHSRLEQRLCLM